MKQTGADSYTSEVAGPSTKVQNPDPTHLFV